MKCVMDEGMPRYKNPYEKGRLIIKFMVNFPPDGFITSPHLSQLEQLLPPREEVLIPDDAEEHDLVKIDPAESRRQRHAVRKNGLSVTFLSKRNEH